MLLIFHLGTNMKCEHRNKIAISIPAPHWWKQECADCGKWIKWLGKNYKPTNKEAGKPYFKPKRKLIPDDVGVIETIGANGQHIGIWHTKRTK